MNDIEVPLPRDIIRLQYSDFFHFFPLHTAPAGLKWGRFHGEDVYTTKESERLLRLPMFYGLKPDDQEFVCDKVKEFFGK